MLFIQNFLNALSLPVISTLIPLGIASLIYIYVLNRWDNLLATVVAGFCYFLAAYAAYASTFVMITQHFGWPSWISTTLSVICGAITALVVAHNIKNGGFTNSLARPSPKKRSSDDDVWNTLF